MAISWLCFTVTAAYRKLRLPKKEALQRIFGSDASRRLCCTQRRLFARRKEVDQPPAIFTACRAVVLIQNRKT